jgi:hypothetical protein
VSRDTIDSIATEEGKRRFQYLLRKDKLLAGYFNRFTKAMDNEDEDTASKYFDKLILRLRDLLRTECELDNTLGL